MSFAADCVFGQTLAQRSRPGGWLVWLCLRGQRKWMSSMTGCYQHLSSARSLSCYVRSTMAVASATAAAARAAIYQASAILDGGGGDGAAEMRPRLGTPRRSQQAKSSMQAGSCVSRRVAQPARGSLRARKRRRERRRGKVERKEEAIQFAYLLEPGQPKRAGRQQPRATTPAAGRCSFASQLASSPST